MPSPQTEHTSQLPWSADTGQQRLAAALARISSNEAKLQHVFTQVFEPDCNDTSKATSSLLSGALISVKDLFDVAGYVTRAGTQFMQNDPVAHTHAGAIQRLCEEGALLVGHTNMTELAYSGLGINPHYGTPANALLPDCIPGGSTAGGAVSVALGLADIAIGTDTGGSLRIPAAFNGIVGFKPSQQCIARDGCKVLSHTLDSVGPMAASVRHCQLAFNAMRQTPNSMNTSSDPVFVIPSNYAMDDLDDAVAQGFDDAVQQLSRAGFTIETQHLPLLDSLGSLAIWQFAAVEARSVYSDAFKKSLELFDPRIASRLARADEVTAVSYRQSLSLRSTLSQRYNFEMHDKILLTPTVPIKAPAFSVFADDESYNRINLQVLRNPSIANVLDGCSVSLPYRYDGNPIGIMLSAPNNHDDWLLKVARDCERALVCQDS